MTNKIMRIAEFSRKIIEKSTTYHNEQKPLLDPKNTGLMGWK